MRTPPDAATASLSLLSMLLQVDKSTIRDIGGIMSLKRMAAPSGALREFMTLVHLRCSAVPAKCRLEVDVLWMVSCDKWQHPNIQRPGPRILPWMISHVFRKVSTSRLTLGGPWEATYRTMYQDTVKSIGGNSKSIPCHQTVKQQRIPKSDAPYPGTAFGNKSICSGSLVCGIRQPAELLRVPTWSQFVSA